MPSCGPATAQFLQNSIYMYVRFCDWLVYPTYDNGFNQKIAYTGKEAWINRILAIVAVLFILAIMIVIIVEVIKRYKRMWDEISQNVFSWKSFWDSSTWRYNQRIFACEFDIVIWIYQCRNHAATSISSKEI